MIPVKICGITSQQDAELAIRYGASAIGMIFYKNSPRGIDIKTAQLISEVVPAKVAKVGVFVNDTIENIHSVVNTVNLDFVQLHGDESSTFCLRIKRPVIKVCGVGEGFSVSKISNFPVYALLLDTYQPGIRGGSGKAFDWNRVDTNTFEKPVILAGGLGPENVLDGIRAINPAAVDVNSGVEYSPGKKDSQKVKALFEVLRSTGSYQNIFNANKQVADEQK